MYGKPCAFAPRSAPITLTKDVPGLPCFALSRLLLMPCSQAMLYRGKQCVAGRRCHSANVGEGHFCTLPHPISSSRMLRLLLYGYQLVQQCNREKEYLCLPWQVLSIGETVVEVNDSGFLGTVPTVRTQLLADDSMLQVRRTAVILL